MTKNESYVAGNTTDALIATEVSVQEKMWGTSEERHDAAGGGQLLAASASQILLVKLLEEGCPLEEALEIALDAAYPEDWDQGAFRTYGSSVANLVVAAAFLRNEIKRRVANGEDTKRSKRGEPYTTAQPAMSSEEALIIGVPTSTSGGLDLK
jgi:hypothetical protein